MHTLLQRRHLISLFGGRSGGRIFSTLVFVFIAVFAVAQYDYSDSLRRKNNKMLIGDLFWSDYDDGFYLGALGSYEMQSAAAGGEVKYYASYYHYHISGSVYANARQLYTNDPSLPNTAVGAGVHFTIFALEGNVYLGGDRTRWYLTPKVGFDMGSFSIFYGYGLRLGPKDLSTNYSHSVSVKYFLHLGAFASHKSRKESWTKYGFK